MKFIQIISHLGELYALDEDGTIWQNMRNPRYVRGPTADQPEFVLRKVVTSFSEAKT